MTPPRPRSTAATGRVLIRDVMSALLAAAVALMVGLPGPAWAASQFWSPTAGSGAWSDALWGSSAQGPFNQNWVGGNDAFFAPATSQTNSLPDGTTVAGKITVQNGGTNNITVTINKASGASGHLQVGILDVPSRGPILRLSGLGSLTPFTKTGSGEVRLEGTYGAPLNGTIRWQGGTGRIFTPSVTGNGTQVVLDGGSLSIGPTSGSAITATIGSLSSTGSGNIVTTTSLTGQGRLIVEQETNTTFAGQINTSANFFFEKRGAGTLTLSRTSSLTNPGRMVIAAGGIRIAGLNSTSQALTNKTIEILQGATLSSDTSGRTLIGSSQVRDQDMIFPKGSATNGFLVQTRGPGAVIDPTGAFAITALDAGDGATVRIDALYERLILHTLTPPAAAGGLRFDLRGASLPGATPIPLLSWIEPANVPLEAFSFILDGGRNFDPAFGTGGARIVRRDGISSLQIQLTGNPLASHNWSDSTELAAGIRHVQLNLTSPRRLSINALRIDLHHPDIRFGTTPQAANYVESSIETIKQTTRNFLSASRSTNRKMIAAINGSPWTPWPPPSPDPGTANITGLAISDGVQVSPLTGAPVFWIGRDWRSAGVAKSPAPGVVANMLHALPGFQVALIHEAPQGNDDKVNGLEPRTGYGVSNDGRHVILMTVDGRQSSFSRGCTVREVGEWLKYFGAADGTNMDGGGSTTMARWTGSSTALLNQPSGGERATGNNLGVYLLETPEQVAMPDWLAFRGAPDGQRGPLDDPAADGIPNLLAYALNIHPVQGETVPGGQARPECEIWESNGTRYMAFTFRMNRHAVGIDVGVELSQTLSAHSWIVPGSLQIASTGPDPVTNDPTYRATVEVTNLPRAFLRLKVTSPGN